MQKSISDFKIFQSLKKIFISNKMKFTKSLLKSCLLRFTTVKFLINTNQSRADVVILYEN
jgi:hypothetical protein